MIHRLPNTLDICVTYLQVCNYNIDNLFAIITKDTVFLNQLKDTDTVRIYEGKYISEVNFTVHVI